MNPKPLSQARDEDARNVTAALQRAGYVLPLHQPTLKKVALRATLFYVKKSAIPIPGFQNVMVRQSGQEIPH